MNWIMGGEVSGSDNDTIKSFLPEFSKIFFEGLKARQDNCYFKGTSVSLLLFMFIFSPEM